MKIVRRALPAITACSILGAAALFAPQAARAETHALIMTIGEYKGGITPLAGVKNDVESARSIARRMGVRDQNVRVYSNDQLTLQGMRRAFAELDERVGDGDQVFIYYSGHGGRERIGDRCAESLITVNGEPFTDEELEAQLKRLSQKARKLIVLLDACHSGGVTTRATPGAARTAGITGKYATRAGADTCERPVNIVTRALNVGTRSAGSGANNYVYIAAARDNEVSLDMAARGGVATQAWRDCISGAAIDRDNSGGLSAEEIRICAQDRINGMLKGIPGFLPHNVTIAGNAQAVLAFRDAPAKPAEAPVAAPPAPPPPAAVAEAPAPAPTPAAPVSAALPAAVATLQDIYNSRDDRRVVTLTASKPAFRINVDDVNFALTSSHAGSVYLLMVGSDGKTFDMLFPNQIDSANAIEAGQTLRLPRPSWQVKAGGPPGKNYLLAIVAESPRDFSKIGMKPAGPFSMVPANLASSKDIQLVTTTSAAATLGECSEPPSKRTLQVQRRCSAAYGAAMMVLEEVN